MISTIIYISYIYRPLCLPRPVRTKHCIYWFCSAKSFVNICKSIVVRCCSGFEPLEANDGGSPRSPRSHSLKRFKYAMASQGPGLIGDELPAPYQWIWGFSK